MKFDSTDKFKHRQNTPLSVLMTMTNRDETAMDSREVSPQRFATLDDPLEDEIELEEFFENILWSGFYPTRTVKIEQVMTKITLQEQ